MNLIFTCGGTAEIHFVPCIGTEFFYYKILKERI